MRLDNIRLPNLSLRRKIVSTVLIITSLAVYIFSWAYILESARSLGGWDRNLSKALRSLRWEDALQYWQLFVIHVAALGLLLIPTYSLFCETSFNRRFRFVVIAIALLCVGSDVALWLFAPYAGEKNIYLGIVGLLTACPLLLFTCTPLVQMWWYRRWRSPTGKPIRVVVVGGGFAGLYAAMGLNKKLGYNHDLELTLLDRRNYFLFPPLLPSAAAGTIETRQVSFPFRRIFETTNIAFRKVSVSEIDPRAGIVRGVIEVSTDPQTGERIERETIQPYDYLVFAPGSSNQTYDVPGVERYAFFMRELNDAVVLRNHVINCFERAAVMIDEDARREMLSFVIVGGGPTGIEIASELYDLIENILLKRYPEIPRGLPQVTIMQSGSQILAGWSPEIVAMTRNQLEKMGIEVRLGMRVSKVGAHSVQAGNVSLQTRTVVWTAGVKPSPLAARSGLELHSCGRIEVQEDCRARGYDNIFVLGDVAHYIDPRTRKALPPLGQVAFQQGTHTAKNLVRLLSGKGTKPFRYFNFGGLVSVGEHFAAVNLLGVTLSGFVGWFVWRTLYLFKLVGFGNKVRVVLDWTLDLVLERSISQIRDERERLER